MCRSAFWIAVLSNVFVLVRTCSGDELARIDEGSHMGEDCTGLVRGEPFSIERVEDCLSQSVRDFGGKIVHGKRLAVLWMVGRSHGIAA